MASRSPQPPSSMCTFVLTTALALGGCLSKGGETGGETHWNKGWLSGCASAAECEEGFECLGNLCTIPCAGDAECEGLDDDAACLDVGEALACGRPGEVEVEPACGDGALDMGEECDDGNNIVGDGCSAQCGFEVCGNMVVDPGEACDDGNAMTGDGCGADCRSREICGDGVLDDHPIPLRNNHPMTTRPEVGQAVLAVEVCDDGNNVDGDGCSSDCLSLEVCGDGYFNAYAHTAADGGTLPPELCDDGNRHDGDGCSASCASLEICGDAILDPGEGCDDGNTIGGDGCSVMCTLER